MTSRSFRRILALAVLALSSASAGLAATTVRNDVCRHAAAPADRIDRTPDHELPFLGTSGPAEEVVAREAGPAGSPGAEGRHRLDPAVSGNARPAVRSPQSVRAVDRRRLGRAPGLARAAAGRLTFFAIAPPLPTV